MLIIFNFLDPLLGPPFGTPFSSESEFCLSQNFIHTVRKGKQSLGHIVGSLFVIKSFAPFCRVMLMNIDGSEVSEKKECELTDPLVVLLCGESILQPNKKRCRPYKSRGLRKKLLPLEVAKEKRTSFVVLTTTDTMEQSVNYDAADTRWSLGYLVNCRRCKKTHDSEKKGRIAIAVVSNEVGQI